MRCNDCGCDIPDGHARCDKNEDGRHYDEATVALLRRFREMADLRHTRVFTPVELDEYLGIAKQLHKATPFVPEPR